MADAAVDTSALDSTPAIELIPLGMYMLSTLECTQNKEWIDTAGARYTNDLDICRIV